MPPYDPTNGSYLDDVLKESCLLRYFKADEANYPTRIMAKALTLELFGGGPTGLRDCVRSLDDEWLASQLRANIALYMRHCALSSLLKHLRRWARTNDLHRIKGSTSWPTLVAEIDLPWVVRRLKEEWKLHSRRAYRRMMELRTDKPWEHIEAEQDTVRKNFRKHTREYKRTRSEH